MPWLIQARVAAEEPVETTGTEAAAPHGACASAVRVMFRGLSAGRCPTSHLRALCALTDKEIPAARARLHTHSPDGAAHDPLPLACDLRRDLITVHPPACSVTQRGT